MSEAVDPGQGYRLLKEGEEILKGDEFLSFGAWETVLFTIGEKWRADTRNPTRRLESPEAAPAEGVDPEAMRNAAQRVSDAYHADGTGESMRPSMEVLDEALDALSRSEAAPKVSGLSALEKELVSALQQFVNSVECFCADNVAAGNGACPLHIAEAALARARPKAAPKATEAEPAKQEWEGDLVWREGCFRIRPAREVKVGESAWPFADGEYVRVRTVTESQPHTVHPWDALPEWVAKPHAHPDYCDICCGDSEAVIKWQSQYIELLRKLLTGAAVDKLPLGVRQ